MKPHLFLALIAFAVGSASAADFPEWMAGSWRVDTGESVVEESWTGSAGGLMLGMSKTVRAKGKTAFEFLRIAEVDGKLAYLAMPGGRPATAFPLRTAGPSRVVFENLQHDFPQRIIYWRDGEKLCARTEGTIKGKMEGEEWCYARMTASQPLFRLQSSFWLNLHHFVRGVARGVPASAPLTTEERETWDKAVALYRQRYIDRDLLMDDGMVAIKDALRQLPADQSPGEFAGEPGLRATLVAIAPIYRKYWWPEHDAANRKWIAAAEPLLARYGQTLSARVAAAYGTTWPQTPHPVDLSVQAGPVGGYTSDPPHTTISSLDPGYQGFRTLEMLFHEASHQWGGKLVNPIARSAANHHKKVPPQLWHGVLFYTAGELTRRTLAEAGVRDYAAVSDEVIPRLCGDGCKQRIAAAWDRHLSGEISADDALDRLVASWPDS
jgi:hypothetical protein